MLETLTKGKEITYESLHEFIDSLAIKPEDKTKLKSMRVEDYIGMAKTELDA